MLLANHFFFYALPMTLFFWGLAYFFTLSRKKLTARKSRIAAHILCVNVFVALTAYATYIPPGSASTDASGAPLMVAFFLTFISCSILKHQEVKFLASNCSLEVK